MPTKSGVQHVWTHADSADSLDVANREIRILLSQRMALGITDEDLSQLVRTCMGCPLKRGALTQEYFCSPSHSVNSGSVSPA